MVKFKSALYARDAERFQVANENFLNACSDIEVRTNEKYVKLDAYFKKTWSSCVPMWAEHLRKSLPTLGDHTTNRVERMFWSLKRSLRDKFISLPKTVASVRHIVQYADDRHQDKT